MKESEITRELIEGVKKEGGSAFQNCRECTYGIHNTDVIVRLTRLAELEDKIEQGTLIELKDRKPLMWGKEGDTVHCQHCGEDLMGVFYGETEIIQCPQCGGFVYGLVAEDYNEELLKELQE